ncbi:MAG: RluA family pseudouridine synthase [Firmicutes bacterium]|nr:RluA family pseudouridine synthase [Bacillota bacterium]
MEVGAGPSRTMIQKAIAAGLATVNGRPAKAAQTVHPGDEVVLVPLPVEAPRCDPEAIPLRLVYEDPDLLVVDKPRGMVVHPAPGNLRGTLVNALLAHVRDLSGVGGTLRPGIVHRLDKDTTGLLVVAKNDTTHLALSAQLKERIMRRRYLALVHGIPKPGQGTIRMPIGRHPFDRKRMAVIADGRPAVTVYTVFEELGAYSLLGLMLETGRTHQIRVHLAAIGHPVVGDRVYGRGRDTLGLAGQALHAGYLSFVHPRTGERLSFTSTPPEDFLALLRRLRREAGVDPEAALPGW